MTCSLPELEAMMKRAKIEHTDRVCREHRVHIVRNGKVRDDLRIEPHNIPSYEKELASTVLAVEAQGEHSNSRKHQKPQGNDEKAAEGVRVPSV